MTRILTSDAVTGYRNGINEAHVQGGFTGGSDVRRGKSIIATTESRSSASYGLLTTPDRVQNVILDTDGLILVAFQATWQESVDGAAHAAIFLGANQLKYTTVDNASPSAQEASIAGGATTVAKDMVLASCDFGLKSNDGYGSPSGATYAGDVTTGQVVGGGRGITTGGAMQFGRFGACHIFAAAGTYDISVQFKASSGSVTAKNRKLWVWTLGF
jgi:hypothetical protein